MNIFLQHRHVKKANFYNINSLIYINIQRKEEPQKINKQRNWNNMNLLQFFDANS